MSWLRIMKPTANDWRKILQNIFSHIFASNCWPKKGSWNTKLCRVICPYPLACPWHGTVGKLPFFCILLKLFVAPFSWTDTQGRSHSSLRQMPTNKKLSKKERKEVQNAQGKSNQLMCAPTAALSLSNRLVLLDCQNKKTLSRVCQLLFPAE